MNFSRGPYVPLPDTAGDQDCVCGSGQEYARCCRPRLERLDRAMGHLETWRDSRRHAGSFRAWSDLLWEEQFRDEEQGELAQEYLEWDEWASFLWLEGILLDGFALSGVPSVPDLVRSALRRKERLPGGARTYEALFASCAGLLEIRDLPPAGEPGLVELWMPPFQDGVIRIPRVFFPEDTEPTDLIVGRFVTLSGLAYPTHRPLVIPVLEDAANYDSAYRVMAPLFPTESAGPAAERAMIRMLKTRGDLVLRAALEALVPAQLEEASDLRTTPPDGGEIRFMVSDAETVTHSLDADPFFSVPGPADDPVNEEDLEDLLENEAPSSMPPEGRRWRLRLDREARRRMPPGERREVEQLLWLLARRTRPRPDEDRMENVARNPGVQVTIIESEGMLLVRALHAPALELGRILVEREIGSFVARGGEKFLTS